MGIITAVVTNIPFPDAKVSVKMSAKINKELTYFTGKPCIKGHVDKRYTRSGICVACGKESKLKHKGKYRETEKKWFLNNKERLQIDARKRMYGLTQEDYEKILNEQNYCCAICNNKLDLGRLTHVDHCHKTNKVRGVLCNVCNLGIGKFRDSCELLQNAINYLSKVVRHGKG